eukprot:CAMPEP_0169066520 /NCGR_PEP_ID=MMETSP1015-20121227/3003_1 /TAXON_ID=342587 /ORGANISM="Karlodinium micrum, Strain CCMP2283" /LENGTH=103 /DNA_ID=CAMNT_0009125211 /DNA_START=80 /DNA_END=391 /DNA_ORIENTATION=+
MSGGGALWGTYDEAANEASFKAAVNAWRQGKSCPEPEVTKPVDRVPDVSLQVGDEVEVRDFEGQSWNPGVVTSIEPLMVQPYGKQKSFSFEMVQRRCEAGTQA